MTKIQFIYFLAQFITVLSNIFIYAMVARVLISWFTMGQNRSRGQFSQFIHDMTDPVVMLVRKLPHKIGMIDLSPLIVIFGIDVISRLLINILYSF